MKEGGREDVEAFSEQGRLKGHYKHGEITVFPPLVTVIANKKFSWSPTMLWLK